MTSDEMFEWLGQHRAALRWDIDERGRQVLELVMPTDDADTHYLTVAANAPVACRDLVEHAVGRMTTEESAQQRRQAMRAVSR